jgi:hypothetical protein
MTTTMSHGDQTRTIGVNPTMDQKTIIHQRRGVCRPTRQNENDFPPDITNNHDEWFDEDGTQKMNDTNSVEEESAPE